MTAQELITQIREIFDRHRFDEDAVYEMWKFLDSVEGEREEGG